MTTPAAAMAVVGLVMTASLSAQRSTVTDAGIQSRWVDKETRTAYDSASRSTVRSLTLIPPGPSGRPSGVTLVWLAFYPGQTVRGTPAGVELRAYSGALSNARVLRDTAIRFSLDEGTPIAMHLRYTGAGGFAGFVTPGGVIPISVCQPTLDELEALSWARDVSGTAIGFDFEFRADQLEALQSFVRTLMPAS